MDMGTGRGSSRKDISQKELAQLSVRKFDDALKSINGMLRDEKTFGAIRQAHDGKSLSSIQRHVIENIKSDLVYNHTLMSISKSNPIYQNTIKLMDSIAKGDRNMSHYALELRSALSTVGLSAPRSTNIEGALMTLSIAVEKMKADHMKQVGVAPKPSQIAPQETPQASAQARERKHMAFGGMGLSDLVMGLKPGSVTDVAAELRKSIEAEQRARGELAASRIARREPPPAAEAIRIRSGMAGAYDLGSNVQYLFPQRDGGLDRKL